VPALLSPRPTVSAAVSIIGVREGPPLTQVSGRLVSRSPDGQRSLTPGMLGRPLGRGLREPPPRTIGRRRTAAGWPAGLAVGSPGVMLLD
jgi:hypothetical protein